MFNKGLRFSYADQKTQRHRVRRVILWAIAFFILYAILSSFAFSMRILENDTMQPGMAQGERFVFSSYKIYNFIPGPDPEKLPFSRGSIVLIDRALDQKRSVFIVLADSIIRFFTAQRIGIIKDKGDVYVKRVIGLPGDEVSMTNFIIRVKPKGSNFSFTESELWDRPYEPFIPSVPALWDESLPFSGNMEAIILGENECFVLSDDRSNTNDSRTWGPVPLRHISGKLLFRYWPLNRIGKP